jgi:ComF family protein
MWMIHSIISKILAVLFPTVCYGCNKRDSVICKTCLARTRKTLSTPHSYIASFYDFQDPLIKKTIHAIKYFHRKDLISPLVQNLGEELKILASEQPSTNCVLVPIPMPLLRKYIRGYNQAELIAREIGKHCSMQVNTTLLTRSSSPSRQATTKTKSARLKNQRNTFKVTPASKEVSVILIDDVTTTGATLEEARKTLAINGIKVLRAITLAH